MKFRLENQRKGFVLLELLVILAIVIYIIIENKTINNFYLAPKESFLLKILPAVIGGIFALLAILLSYWLNKKKKRKKK
jgi:hypothetical protein